MITFDCIIVRSSNQACFSSLFDAEDDATDAMVSGTPPEKHNKIRIDSKYILKNQLLKIKKTVWSAEITNDPHIMKLDEHGNFVVCLVCNDFGSSKGKKELKCRRLFSETNWDQHKLISVKHKIALDRMEFERERNKRKRKQTGIHSFFNAEKK